MYSLSPIFSKRFPCTHCPLYFPTTVSHTLVVFFFFFSAFTNVYTYISFNPTKASKSIFIFWGEQTLPRVETKLWHSVYNAILSPAAHVKCKCIVGSFPFQTTIQLIDSTWPIKVLFLTKQNTPEPVQMLVHGQFVHIIWKIDAWFFFSFTYASPSH